MIGLANRITVARAVLTMGIWGALAYAQEQAGLGQDAGWWTGLLVIFLLTAITDVLDGYLARRFSDVTLFGRVVDPLVDKMLTLGCMIVLLGFPWVTGILAPWMVAAMFCREVTVTTLRAVVEGRGVAFPAVGLGKLKMLTQTLCVAALLALPIGWPWLKEALPGLAILGSESEPASLPRLLAWLATGITVLSGGLYVLRAARVLRERAQ